MKDLENPGKTGEETEDPSVVVTADDSSTSGSLDEAASSTSSTNGKAVGKKKMFGWMGGVLALLVLTVVIVVAAVSSAKDKDSSTSSLSGFWKDGEDSASGNHKDKPGCNKTQDPLALVDQEESTPAEHVSKDEEKLEMPTELPFDQVPIIQGFSPKVLEGYPTEQDLHQDLMQVGKHILNQVILENVARHQYYSQTVWGSNDQLSRERPSTTSTAAAQQAGQEIASAASSSSTSTTTSTTTEASKTNNQEHDADEADLVKNDQNYVYAVLGDYLVVWDISSGEQITHVQMPSLDGGDDNNNNWNWSPPTRINAIMLTPHHVILMVDARNNNDNNKQGQPGLLSKYQATQLRVYSKPTPNNTEMNLLATQNLQGVYRDGRWLEESQSIHLVLSGDINAYSYLVEPLSYSHFNYINDNDETETPMTPMDYVAAATELATNTLLPEFVKAVTETLKLQNGQLPQMLQINGWYTPSSSSTVVSSPSAQEILARLGATTTGPFYESTSNLPLRAFIQVVSIHVDDLPHPPTSNHNNNNDGTILLPQESLPVASSLLMGPTTDCHFYGTENHLVVAFEHLSYNNNNNNNNDESTRGAAAEENLFVLHLGVSVETASADEPEILTARVTANFHSVATVPGHLNSAYSMDIQGNDLRLATTVQKWNFLERVGQLCGGDRMQFLEGTSNNNDECQIHDSLRQCFNLAMDGCTEIIQDTGSCPYTYACAQPERMESSTDNFVMVFDLSSSSSSSSNDDMMMTERGRVRIGHDHEVITSVHFGETFSYATTFDQRDPFIVLQLEPEQPPAVLGELELDGFSSYLHPLDDFVPNKLIVGIGQNTTGTGLDQRNTGVMVTVFDVSNPAAPVAVASHMLENDDKIESYTNVAWDAKAVQYANGKLVLPVTMFDNGDWNEVDEDDSMQTTGEDNMDEELEVARGQDDNNKESIGGGFKGFFVLNVGPTGITEAFRINNVNTANTCHYCHGGLTDSRSILMDDGSLMTMFDESVQSTNMTTGETLWTMTVELEGVSKDCCW